MAIAESLFERDETALLRIWRKAEADLKRVIAAVKSTDFQRQRSQVLLSQVEAIISDLQNGTQRWLDRTLPKAFEAGFNWTGSGFAPGDFGAFATIPRAAVDAVILSIANDSRQALASVAPNFGAVFTHTQQAIATESALMEQVALNLIQGKGPQALARDIAATLRDGAMRRLEGAAEGAVTAELKRELQQTAEGQFISILCKDGKVRRYNLRSYSETVARSSSRMAQTEGTLTSCQQLGIDLVQISVHAGACPAVCAPIQGKVYSISGQSPDFPALSTVGRAPYHPKCRHVMLPAPEAFLHRRGIYDTLRDFSVGEEQVADAYAYRDLLRGPVRELVPA